MVVVMPMASEQCDGEQARPAEHQERKQDVTHRRSPEATGTDTARHCLPCATPGAPQPPVVLMPRKSPERVPRKSITLPDRLWVAVGDFRFSRRRGSEGEAVRRRLRAGLEAEWRSGQPAASEAMTTVPDRRAVFANCSTAQPEGNRHHHPGWQAEGASGYSASALSPSSRRDRDRVPARLGRVTVPPSPPYGQDPGNTCTTSILILHEMD
jgi:hypothetical protein